MFRKVDHFRDTLAKAVTLTIFGNSGEFEQTASLINHLRRLIGNEETIFLYPKQSPAFDCELDRGKFQGFFSQLSQLSQKHLVDTLSAQYTEFQTKDLSRILPLFHQLRPRYYLLSCSSVFHEAFSNFFH